MKIHFIGIGGIGVSALAQYYLANNWQVSGSDLASSETTTLLKKKGAKIIMRHFSKNVPEDVEILVYSPAVKLDNPELKRAYHLQEKNKELKILSYPQALGELTKKYFTIAVCGTHGKSTTSAMLSLILLKAGLDPTVIIGTKLKEFKESNFREGKSKYLIIEADEHFASFLNYSPNIIVLNNIEADHLDYYKNFKNYFYSFEKFISHLDKNGLLVINEDDQSIQKLKMILCDKNKSREKIKIKGYSIKQKQAKKLKKILKIPGNHNVYNALASLTVARYLKIKDKLSYDALSKYKGAWRRFDLRKKIINNQKITLIYDYGHHPTEIKTTLEAVREYFPRKKIFVVFQPHQYQRTFYLFDDFVKAIQKSQTNLFFDELIITDIYDVAGREDKKIKKKINSKKIVEKINKESVIYLPKNKIKKYLEKNIKKGNVLLVMGAGDIYNFFQKNLTEKEKKEKINK